uniref:Uncharacterized protein n=1 Tax=Solanum tuberosum TaxID=4113 RepID=M1DBZ5_SOLTU
MLHKLEEKAPALYARLDDAYFVIRVRGVNIPLNATAINEEDQPIGQPYRCDLSLGVGGGVRYIGHPVKCGGANHLIVEDVLPRSGSTSRSKMRRTSRANSSRAAAGSDGEDPLSGARVEENLEAVQERMGSAYTEFTSVPPNTTLEVEMLRHQLCKERRKGVFMDRLMLRMWKTIKTMFTCVASDKELPRLEPPDFMEFSMLNEVWSGVTASENLDSDIDTTQSESP